MARPDVRAPLLTLLDRAPNEGAETRLAALRTEAPEDFALLSFVVAGGYLQSRQVQDALGYFGQAPAPFDEPDATEAFEPTC